MAERVPPSDETAAVNAGETVAVPNATPTDAVELAWSSGDDVAVPDEPTDGADEPAPATVYQSWGTTLRNAGLLLLVGLGVAGLIVVGRWLLTSSESPTASAPSATQATTKATTTAPATADPGSILSTADQDSSYVQALNDRGIAFANPDAAVYNGKMVCENIRLGMTVPQVVSAFQSSSPQFAANANAYVGISVRTYCPQYKNQVAGF
ncbi:DUF732 domain-containing protein [Mycobacterium sp. 1423905.2]|uniref:DUF732 domain-containing protein n=1 Tax=Mycobacterium sp. 1423905.2 TaxID=1856859 RepID=UPI0020A33518|nr:DUF732 domain-containing protein [Mycobacterium sp. 1423905.2]